MYRNIICRIIHGYCSILVFWIVKNLMTTRTKDKRLLKQVQLRCPTLYCNIRLYTYPNLGAEISGLNICPIAEDFNVLLCVCFRIILLLVQGNMTLWNCKDILINGLQANEMNVRIAVFWILCWNENNPWNWDTLMRHFYVDCHVLACCTVVMVLVFLFLERNLNLHFHMISWEANILYSELPSLQPIDKRMNKIVNIS